MESREAEQFTLNWQAEVNEMVCYASNNYCTFYGSSSSTASSFALRSPSPIPLSPLWNCSPPHSPLHNCPTHTPSTELTLNSDPENWIQSNYPTCKFIRVLTLVLPDSVETIADSIGELPYLNCLRIRGRGLKFLPDRITSLQSLLVLDLQRCHRLQELPANIHDLVNLKYLGIMGSSRIRHLPNSITRLPNLLVLDLRDCFSLKELPANMNELSSLKFLYIKGCYIEYLPNTVTKLRELLVLDLRDDYMVDQLPANLNELINLRTLSIRHSNIRYLPNNLVKLCSLQTLELHSCLGLKELPENLNELVSLKYLCIRGSFIESLPNNITKLSNLQFLELQDCFDIKELPANLNELVNLRNLIVRHTKITSIPDSLTSLHNLQVLDLQGCSLLEDLPANLDDLVSLRGLILRGTRIRSLPNSITNLPNLHILDVSCCFILETFPANFDELVTLKGIKIIGLPSFQGSNSPAHEGLLPVSLMLVDGIPLDSTVSQSEISNEDQISSSSDQALAEEDSDGKLASENKSSEHIDEAGIPEGNGQVDILGSESEDRMGSSHGDDTAEECTSNDERNDIGGLNSNHDQQDGQMNKILGDEFRKARKHITLQDIQQLLSKNMKLVDAANELGVSRSTLKRRWKDFDIGPWPSSRTTNVHSGNKQRHNAKSAPGSNSSQPQRNLSTPSGPTGGENVQEYLVATKDKTSKTFSVKATYNSEIIRFDLLSTSTISEIKEQVQKRLNVEVSKIRIQYLDDDNDWVLMACAADLQNCLHLSELTGTNRVKLKILDT